MMVSTVVVPGTFLELLTDLTRSKGMKVVSDTFKNTNEDVKALVDKPPFQVGRDITFLSTVISESVAVVIRAIEGAHVCGTFFRRAKRKRPCKSPLLVSCRGYLAVK